jgi:hypothetical protein
MSSNLSPALSFKWIGMNYFLFTTISALSIALPCITGLCRFKQISTSQYLPLLMLLLTGFLNECLSFTMITWHKSNLVNANIYTLLEYLLYVWLFYKIRKQSLILVIAGLSGGVLVWIADNLILHNLTSSNSLFRIMASLVIIWFSIDKLSQLTFTGVTDKYKRVDLLLCFSLLAYFTFRGFIHVFKQFSIGHTPVFQIHLWIILCLLNILVNISLCITILWIPKQQPTIQYS